MSSPKTPAEPRWVRLLDIGKPDCGLTVDERIGVMATALTELGIAQGLVLVHGPEHGYQRYTLLRGKIRFDAAGEVEVRVE